MSHDRAAKALRVVTETIAIRALGSAPQIAHFLASLGRYEIRAASRIKIVAVLGDLVNPLLLNAATLQELLDGPGMSKNIPTSGESVVYLRKFVGRIPSHIWLYVGETGNFARRIAAHGQFKSTNAATQLVHPQATTIENAIIAIVPPSRAKHQFASMFSGHRSIQHHTNDHAAKILRMVIETISMHALVSLSETKEFLVISSINSVFQSFLCSSILFWCLVQGNI